MNDDLVNKSGDLVNDLVNDTISRAAALSALNGLTKIFLNNLPPTIDRADAVDAIKALPSAQPKIAENLYLYKCFITDKDGLQHEVIHTGDIRRVTGWEI